MNPEKEPHTIRNEDPKPEIGPGQPPVESFPVPLVRDGRFVGVAKFTPEAASDWVQTARARRKEPGQEDNAGQS